MKTLFIEAREDKNIVIPQKLINILPDKTALFTSVQFIGNIDSISKQIIGSGKKVVKIKPHHSEYECQLLGCSIEKFTEEFESFLYIGDGEFHPKALMLKNDKPVFIYNPYSEKFFELDKDDIEKMRKKVKGALLKFYVSNEIGVLISTKDGQNKINEAKNLKTKYPDKNFYMLVFDTIDFNSLEDFNFIDCFVNTACSRIGYDDSIKLPKPVLDISELE